MERLEKWEDRDVMAWDCVQRVEESWPKARCVVKDDDRKPERLPSPFA